MARTPEGKVKDKVTAVLRDLGAYYFFPATGGYGRSGVPDIVGCYGGRFFGFECKTGNNQPTPLQERELETIFNAGGVVAVINEDNCSAEAISKLLGVRSG